MWHVDIIEANTESSSIIFYNFNKFLFKSNPVNTKHLYSIYIMLDNVENVGPTLYKRYTNVLFLHGIPFYNWLK